MKNIRLQIAYGIVFLFASLLISLKPAFAIRYNVTDLHPTGYSDSSEAWSINNTGDVTGNVGANIAVWLDETPQVLSYSGTGIAINASAQVTGFYHITVNGSDQIHPFIWENNTLTGLSLLNNGTQGTGYGIDNSGNVVGYSITGSGEWRASKWASGSTTATALPIFSSSTPNSVAWGISNDGNYAVGHSSKPYYRRPTMWESGSVTDLTQNLNPPVTVRNSLAYDVNNQGNAVGYITPTTPSQVYAALWKDGELIQISTAQSHAWAINNNDQLVGQSNYTPNSADNAFYWSPENGLSYLNDLVPEDSTWDLRVALDINDEGQIVGWGVNPNGDKHAYRLDPVVQWTIISANDDLFYGNVTETDFDDLYDLWFAGKNGQNPAPLEINGERWEYFAEVIPNHDIGDTWISNGYKYIYLGSGVRAKINETVPEPASVILVFTGLIGLMRRIKR